jgi:hypothetical protein
MTPAIGGSETRRLTYQADRRRNTTMADRQGMTTTELVRRTLL